MKTDLEKFRGFLEAADYELEEKWKGGCVSVWIKDRNLVDIGVDPRHLTVAHFDSRGKLITIGVD